MVPMPDRLHGHDHEPSASVRRTERRPNREADPMADELKRREDRLRRRADRQGLALRKSRARPSMDNHGGYMIVEAYTTAVVAGQRFDLDLDEVEAYLLDEEEEARMREIARHEVGGE